MIFGRPGSGKSTLALTLAKKLQLPLYHLDKYYFVANWKKQDYSHFLSIQKTFVTQEDWIIDGCSLQSLEMRYARANICIYLKFNRWLCLFRLVKRIFFKDPCIQDRAEGCSEGISWELIKYTWTFEYRLNNRLKHQISSLQQKYPNVKFYTIYNDRELKSLIITLSQKQEENKESP